MGIKVKSATVKGSAPAGSIASIALQKIQKPSK